MPDCCARRWADCWNGSRTTPDERCLDDLLDALDIPVPPVAESPRARFFALRQELLNLVIASEHPGSVKAIFLACYEPGGRCVITWATTVGDC